MILNFRSSSYLVTVVERMPVPEKRQEVLLEWSGLVQVTAECIEWEERGAQVRDAGVSI